MHDFVEQQIGIGGRIGVRNAEQNDKTPADPACDGRFQIDVNGDGGAGNSLDYGSHDGGDYQYAESPASFTKRASAKQAGEKRARLFGLGLLSGLLLPFLGSIPSGGRRAAEILLRQKRTNLVHGEHGLLCAKHVRTFRIRFGRHHPLKIGSDIGDNGFGLRTVASMKMDNEIADAGKHIR